MSFRRAEVQRRYDQFARDNFGEIDIPNLCETMVSFGERRAIAAMTEFSDVLPRISHMETRIQAIRRLLLSILAEAEDVEQEALF